MTVKGTRHARRPDQDNHHNLQFTRCRLGKAQQNWDDDMSHHFDARHWTPMLNEPRTYLAALCNLLELLGDMERDTEC